jgi:hypothetical protein
VRTLRQQPPIFIWSLTMRWGCSAGLFGEGYGEVVGKAPDLPGPLA